MMQCSAITDDLEKESAVYSKLVLGETSTHRQQKLKFRDIYPQVLASCISLSFVIQAGISMSFSAILLPQLMDPKSSLKISIEEASWIASLMAIGTPIGSFICGPLMDYFGRKKFSLICCVPNIIAWLMIIFTQNSLWLLYLGRITAGLSGGMSTVTNIYVAEITHQHIRPMMLSLNSVFVSFGIFLTTLLGSYLHWRTVSICCAFCTLATFLLTLFINPESPVWLLNFNKDDYKRTEEAKHALSWLNPDHQIFIEEWQKLITNNQNKVTMMKDKENTSKHCCSTLLTTLSAFSTPSAFKPLFILVVIFFLQQTSGSYPIIFYAVQIFQSAQSNLNEYTALVMLGALRFVMSIVCFGLSGAFGRRTLMITSSLGMAVSSLVAAFVYSRTEIPFYKYNDTMNADMNNSFVDWDTPSTTAVYAESDVVIPSWVGVLCIIVFVAISAIGVLTIPWTLSGELLPTAVRGTGTGIMVSYAYILLFLVVKYFPHMLIVLQVSELFYIFSFVSCITALFVYFFLPETLGKSFDEIESYFSNSKTDGKMSINRI